MQSGGGEGRGLGGGAKGGEREGGRSKKEKLSHWKGISPHPLKIYIFMIFFFHVLLLHLQN